MVTYHPVNQILKYVYDEELFAPLHSLTRDLSGKVGILQVYGFAEQFDVRFPAVMKAAEEVDYLAIWFQNNVTFPPLVNGADRWTVVEALKSSALYKTPILIRNFITGCENQLLRRVIAIGTNIPILEEVDFQLHALEVRRAKMVPHWMEVPSDHEDRNQPPSISDDDLGEIIRWVWKDIVKENRAKTDEQQEKQMIDILRGGGLFSVTPFQMRVVMRRTRGSARKMPDIDTMRRLVKDYTPVI